MDFKGMFDDGSKPSLEAVLDNREKREAYSRHLLESNPKCAVVCLKCNIPGAIKNNEYITALFEYGFEKIKQSLISENMPIVFERRINLPTGPESFFVIDKNAVKVKKLLLDFETGSIGRIFDADVACMKDGALKNISRDDLGLEERKCFICDLPAKQCASRRVHTVEEMQKFITKTVCEHLNKN